MAPIKQVFEYDPDEGSALIKAQLYLQGFSLYKEIWDDQPPLLTVILSYCFKLFGLSIYYARILILISSGILLWALYLIIMRLNGALCALISAIFLILSTDYLQLSISVMPGIPSLAFAMLSIYCAMSYKKSYFWLLILSGIFMAISLQIKLITAFLIPLILLEIILAEKIGPNAQKKQNRLFYAVIFWLSGFAVAYLTTIIIFFHFNTTLFFQQLFLPHLKRLILEKNSLSAISLMIFTDYDIVLLALTRIIVIAKERKKQFYFPVIWLTLTSVILFMHRPLWRHYYPLIAAPLCWLAAISFSEFFHPYMLKNPPNKKNLLYWLTACLIIITIIRTPVKYHRMIESIKKKATIEEHRIVNLLVAHKNHTRWMITDRPIFAFYAGILVPPELALISNKRILAKSFTKDYLLSILEKYKPEQILFTRLMLYETKILSCVGKNYIKIYQGKLYNRIWQSLFLRQVNRKIKLNQQILQYKLPIIQGGFSYAVAEEDIKLYLRKNSKWSPPG